jgi:hypothetical protein
MTTIMGIAQPIIVDLEWVVAAARGGWGVTKYFQLDWMDDGTNGWKKLHDDDVLHDHPSR